MVIVKDCSSLKSIRIAITIYEKKISVTIDWKWSWTQECGFQSNEKDKYSPSLEVSFKISNVFRVSFENVFNYE